MVDRDGALALLVAVGRLWAKDARQDPDELPGLADWLDLTTDELRAWLQGRQNRAPAPASGWPTCRACGARLPEPTGRRGRERVYCSSGCRYRWNRRGEHGRRH